MRRLILLTLLAAAGCQSSSGSLGYGKSSRGDATIAEQKAYNRERYPIIEDDRLTPKAYVDRPSFTGR